MRVSTFIWMSDSKRVSIHELAMRFSALYHLAAIRIERVVDDPLRRIVFVVVLEPKMPEAFGDSFEAGTLRLMIQRVIGVGTVDDPPKQHQRWITRQLVLLQDRFERAFLAVMAKLDAIPYDVKDVELGHHGKECSFEAILKKYKLTGDPALVLLGRIVNGADTDNTLYHQPEGPGLEAVAEGFRHLGFKDDHEHNAAEWIVYDALYAYCREMIRQGHSKGAFVK